MLNDEFVRPLLLSVPVIVGVKRSELEEATIVVPSVRPLYEAVEDENVTCVLVVVAHPLPRPVRKLLKVVGIQTPFTEKQPERILMPRPKVEVESLNRLIVSGPVSPIAIGEPGEVDAAPSAEPKPTPMLPAI